MEDTGSVADDFGHGHLGSGLVDDGLVGCEGGNQGLKGEVVDRAWQAAGSLVDDGDGVVGEEEVGAAGKAEVVADIGVSRYPWCVTSIRQPSRIRG